MTKAAGTTPKPFFMAGSEGDLFATYYRPSSTNALTDAVLFVPPFAEEMNKARRLCALTGRYASSLGLGWLQIDLFGTGDSRGDFADARWKVWLDDLQRGLDFLQERGHARIHIVALRLGCLLAAELEQATTCGTGQLVLWQPIVKGDQFLTQFLRLRMASSMISETGPKETTEDLRARLTAGETIEVGGYSLHPDLAAAIQTRDLATMPLGRSGRIHWLEIVANEGRQLSPVGRRTIDALIQSGLNVSANTVVGAPFWSTVEIAAPEALIEATGAALTEGSERA